MRLALRPATPVEWLALRTPLVPTPAAEAWAGQALSGTLVAAVRTGIVPRLAESPATAAAVAADLGLAPVPTTLVLDSLVAARHLRRRGSTYRLTRTTARWLDPAADLPLLHFIAAAGDYFDWWRDLPDVVRTGVPVAHHDRHPDDPYWRRYILGQLDLARLSAAEVARKLRLPGGARRVLDIGGGHGWYSHQLCLRHPGLTATVLDLPGSTDVGRALGLDPRVRYADGDVRDPAVLTALSGAAGAAETTGASGRYDAVLCFNLLHHLTEPQIAALLATAHDLLVPGGTLAVLDGFAEPGRRGSSAAANQLGLFMYLSSGSRIHSPEQLRTWFAAAGFPRPRRSRILRMPGLTLHQARRA